MAPKMSTPYSLEPINMLLPGKRNTEVRILKHGDDVGWTRWVGPMYSHRPLGVKEAAEEWVRAMWQWKKRQENFKV